MRLLRALVLSGLVGAALLPATTSHAQTEVVDRIVARVNDGIVTLSDIARTLPIYIQVVGVDPGLLRTEEGRAAVARDVMNRLIEDRLILADARTRGLALTDGEVDAYLAQQRERLGVTEQAFRAELERQGLFFEDFREFIRGHITRQRMMQLDVGARVEITAQQLDAAIAEMYPDGLQEISITTSHVLVQVPPGAGGEVEVAARDRLQALRDEIAAGRTFEDVAAATNTDASRNTGGRIGRFGINELDPDYSRAALGLEIGELSQPVRSQFGWHLIRLDALERTAVRNEAAIRDAVEFQLYQREAARQQQVFVNRLRSDAYVQIVTEDLGL